MKKLREFRYIYEYLAKRNLRRMKEMQPRHLKTYLITIFRIVWWSFFQELSCLLASEGLARAIFTWYSMNNPLPYKLSYDSSKMQSDRISNNFSFKRIKTLYQKVHHIRFCFFLS